jgi:DNA-binding MarR family transcriptional regulator
MGDVSVNRAAGPGAPAREAPDRGSPARAMTDPGAELDPVIHVPARLRIAVTLAALPDGDALSFSRLQQLLDLTAGNLITHLRKLEQAGYVASVKSRDDGTARTALRLTLAGRAALAQYSATLRYLLDQAGVDGSGSGPLLRTRPPEDNRDRC